MARRPNCLVAESVQLTYSLYVVLAYEYFESCDLFEHLLMDNCHHQTPAQVTCAHCQRSSGPASAPFPLLEHFCSSEPHILQAFCLPSIPREEVFCFPSSSGWAVAGRGRIMHAGSGGWKSCA